MLATSMILTVILGALAIVSLVLMLWQLIVAMRFPLHQQVKAHDPLPAVSILKPLRGLDSETEGCLRSWFQAPYKSPVQLLFGVADAGDPVCPLVKQLIEQHPERSAELVICPKRFGANAKVSTLIQLARLARHEAIVVSDADVWIPPELIQQALTLLVAPNVALVNCFYRLASPSHLPARLEVVAVNADFWSHVLQARSLRQLHFALGAVMVARRKDLEQIGGFEALVDYLADDYQLGNRIARAGGVIELCNTVVECRSSVPTWHEVWTHQVRWARTIRFCEPMSYFFSILGNATLWPLLFAGFGQVSWKLVSISLPLVLGLRMIVAAGLQKRLTGAAQPLRWCWLPLLKDLLAVAVWATAFLGNTVTWRGSRYRVRKGGKLQVVGE